MADHEVDNPLAVLADRPLAPPPPLAEIEGRASHRRRRRWATRSGGALVAVVALVAGIVTLAPDSEQTVHTAGPAAAGDAALSGPSGIFGNRASGEETVVHELEAGGRRWQVVAVARDQSALCLAVSSDDGHGRGTCWDVGAAPLQASVTVVPDGPAFVTGLASVEVESVELRSAPGRNLLIPFGPEFPGGFVAIVVPEGLSTVELRASTGDRPAFTVTLDVPDPAMAAPPSTVAREVPPAPPTTPAVPPTTVAPPPTTAPPVTSPPVTIAPAPGAKRVTVDPDAVQLNRMPFTEAGLIGPQTVAVRYWAGVEPCTLLGRVDVVETATTVTITVWVGGTTQLIACTAQAVYYETLVELSAPLGNRTIVDGAA